MNYEHPEIWLRDLESFGNALSRLDDACAQDIRAQLELAGLMRTFMLVEDLGCDAFWGLLVYEGFDPIDARDRDTIRIGFQGHHLSESDAETFLELFDMREKMRNILDTQTLRETAASIKQTFHPLLLRLHATLVDRAEQYASGTYAPRHQGRPKNAVLKDRYRQAIIDVLAACDRVERVVLFGSRATATNTPDSDVDILLFGADLTASDQTHLNLALDDLTVPQKVDLAVYADIRNPGLLEDVRTHGVEWYRRPDHADADTTRAGREPTTKKPRRNPPAPRISMNNPNATRWKKRLDRLGRILLQLDHACQKDSYTELEFIGLIHTFMLTQEKGWQTLKDLLAHEGHDPGCPRDVVRIASEQGHLSESDAEVFFDVLDKRNRISHACDAEAVREAETIIKQEYHPMLQRLHAYLAAKAE